MGRKEQKEQFVSQIRNDMQWQVLFNHLPRVCFFVKDRESRMMAACNNTLQRLGAKSELDIIGRPDTDFFPDQVARGYCEDDHTVLTTAEPVIDRLEVWKSEGMKLQWHITTKYPLFNDQNEVIGIMGFTQPSSETGSFVAYSPLVAKAVNYIETRYADPVRIEPIGKELGVSTRSLHRKFQQEIGTSVRAFQIRTRVMAAANQLLETDRSIVEIALAVGFCDQSALSKAFRKEMGCTPGEFRRRSGGL